MIGFSAVSGRDPPGMQNFSSVFNSRTLLSVAEESGYKYELSYVFLSNLTCPENASLNGSICTCNPKFYETSWTCKPCAALCEICTSLSNCLVCVNNNSRWPVSGYCVCIDGYFSTGGADTCRKCLNVCATCNGPDSCLTCIDSSNRNISTNCTCNSGKYQSPYNSSCVPCVYPCLTCVTNTTCLSCYSNIGRNVSGSCSCGERYFDNGAWSCASCHARCFTCVNTSTNCLIC